MLPLAMRLATLFVVGACLGSLVNWAIYTLAWNRRLISPWSPPPPGVPPRTWSDRSPVFGWLLLKREAHVHGPRFWLRPMLLEIGIGAMFAGLYWWEVVRLGLIHDQVGFMPGPLNSPHWQFVSHVLLACWMIAASFIDIDEKTIPDEITVTGTLLGLLLATLVPMSMLPQVVERAAPPVVGEAIINAAGAAVTGQGGGPLWLEPVTLIAPHAWPPTWAEPKSWPALAVGLGCYWLWCFALAPRTWRGRRGAGFALRLIMARVNRELARSPLCWLLMSGTFLITLVFALDAQGWNFAHAAWEGLLTALVGLAASGGLVWAVRLVGTWSLKREAMGFGDVTLMMMIGTFLGWQACIILFFLSPLPALLVGIAQYLLRRDDVIAYGPYLCLAAAVAVVAWAPIWIWAQPIFGLGWLVPAVLVICLALLGVILAVWQMIKTILFGRGG